MKGQHINQWDKIESKADAQIHGNFIHNFQKLKNQGNSIEIVFQEIVLQFGHPYVKLCAMAHTLQKSYMQKSVQNEI